MTEGDLSNVTSGRTMVSCLAQHSRALRRVATKGSAPSATASRATEGGIPEQVRIALRLQATGKPENIDVETDRPLQVVRSEDRVESFECHEERLSLPAAVNRAAAGGPGLVVNYFGNITAAEASAVNMQRTL